jgi:hypothetical protein
LEKPQIAGIEDLRVLITKERKDRLALATPIAMAAPTLRA